MRHRILLFIAVALIALPLAAEERSAGDKFAIFIEQGDLAAIRALVEGGASPDTWIEYGEHKITPLMKAAWARNAEIVEYLLGAGAKVNAAAPDSKETALMNAVSQDSTEIARMLIKAKADVTPRNAYDFNAFTSAVAAGNQEMAGLLLDAGAKIEDGVSGLTPLMFAASSGNIDMMRFLVGRGADVNHGAKKGEQTALLSAIYSAKVDVVKALIELKADVNTKTKDGTTPLSAAQKGDQDDVIAVLKAAGAKK